MDFAFSEQQDELRAAVRHVLERECTTADLRAMADGVSDGRRAERWAVLAGLGATGLLVGEGHGGLGLGEVDLVGVLEEAGWAALPEPLGESAWLAARLLEQLGDEVPPARAKEWLAGLATGELVGVVGGIAVGTALTGSSAVDGSGVRTPWIPAGFDVALVALDRSTGSREDWEIYGVERDQVEVEVTPGIDATRTLQSITWVPDATTLLVSGPRARALVEDTASAGAVAAAAQLLGVSDRMIAISAEYAKNRQQFGKPIGSFQAVKHHLANARVKLEFARPATYRAADSLARQLATRHRDASMAKALASDAADVAARISLQVHGAIGYTWECDLQFFLKRAWALSSAWGAAPVHRARVLRSVLDELGRAPG